MEMESGLGIAKTWEEGQMGRQHFMDTEFQCGNMKKVLEINGGEGCECH